MDQGAGRRCSWRRRGSKPGRGPARRDGEGGEEPGELTGLRWSDVDLDAGRLTVEVSLKSERTGLRVGETKTPKSRRPLTLPPKSRRPLTLPQPGRTGPLDTERAAPLGGLTAVGRGRAARGDRRRPRARLDADARAALPPPGEAVDRRPRRCDGVSVRLTLVRVRHPVRHPKLAIDVRPTA